MKISVFFVLVFLSSLVYPQSQQSNTPDSSVVLSGEGYSFTISVPAGWVCETGQGTWTGAKAILFPRNVPSSKIHWGNPDAWITIGIASKQAEGKQTLNNLIAFYSKVDSQEAATVSNQPNLLTQDKKTVLIKQKAGSRSYGAIAYIDDETIVTVFELRRFDEHQFNETLPKFKQIVASYRSVSSDKKPGK